MDDVDAVELLDIGVLITTKGYEDVFVSGELIHYTYDVLEAAIRSVLFLRMGTKKKGNITFSELSYNGKYIVHWA